MKPKISVLLVVYNEEKHIDSALHSVYNQTLCKQDIELIVIDGGSTDSTISICNAFKSEYQTEFHRIELLSNPKKVLASGWNIGIEQSKADYVIRFDGHSTLAPDYIENGLSELTSAEQNVVCVGGWMEHKSDSVFGKFAAIFYSSIIGGGSAAFRRQPKELIESDTALFAVYKKKDLVEAGLFDESLARNQDIDLHKRLKSVGLTFRTSPKMMVTYFVRASLSQFLKKAYKDGFWVGASKGYFLRHLVPCLFLIYISLACVAQIIFDNKALLFTIWLPLAFYFTVIFLDLNRGNKTIKESLISMPLFFLYHIYYGSGTLIGLIRKLKQ